MARDCQGVEPRHQRAGIAARLRAGRDGPDRCRACRRRAAARRSSGPNLPPIGSLQVDALVGHLRDERVDIVADQIELVEVVALVAVDAELGRRQLEDQPAAAPIDAGDLQHVAQESAVGRLVLR